MKAEDDAGVVIINGEIITVEQQVTRTWNAPINGFWDVSSNWTGNQLPVAGDDVIISFPSNNITTTYRTGNNSLNSVLSDEAFVINGGILTVNNLTVNDTLTLSNGTLALNGTTGSTVDNLTQSGGTLSGTGEVIVNNNYNWTSGTQSGSGKTTLKGTTNISTTNTKSVDTRTIENQGTVTWTNGDIYLYNGATWNNTATGVFDIQGNNGFYQWYSNQAKLNNAGTLKKTAGTGTTTISTQLNNTGTVQVQTGTLNLTGGGSSSGVLQVNSGANLNFGGGNHTLSDGQLTGSGIISVNGANLTVSGAIVSDVNNLTLSNGTLALNGTTGSTVDNLTQSGGTLSGTGEVIVNNNYNWTSGTQSGTGKTTLKGTTNISTTNTKSVDTRTIENQGTVTWTNGDIYLYNGATWNNTATGVFDIQGNNGFYQWYSNQAKLNNAGTLKKTAGTGTTTISTQLNNTGTVQVQTGTLNLTGGGSSSGNWNLSNGATLQLANNYTLQGGVVTGNGTVIGNVANLTQINPGDGVGQLNITGNYNQNSSATLNIELGGNTNYDKLNITGNATLGGTLNISLVNGFAPVLGERYTIFNYGGTLTGGFSNINGLNLGNGLLLQSLIVNKSLVLDVVQDVNYKPGIFSFATTNFSVNENGTPVNAITINRTAGTDGIVSVTLTPTAGTATAGTDYNSSPITITFNPGEASKTVNIPIIDDNIYEGNETLNLTLSSPTGGATLGTQTTATLTIVDNDLPTVSLAVSPASVTEDGTSNLVYTFTRTGNTANPLTVSFNVGGNATFNNDYTQNGAASFNATSGTITFAAGSDTATLTIDPTADTIFEQDETVSLTLVSSANYIRETTNTVTSTIINDDVNAGVLSFSNSQFSVNEDGTPVVAVTVNRTGNITGSVSATINLTNGTATAPSDYNNTPITV
ncbi:beta strand repeat-containing protein, partial [Microcystis aeruginosa]